MKQELCGMQIFDTCENVFIGSNVSNAVRLIIAMKHYSEHVHRQYFVSFEYILGDAISSQISHDE